MIQICLMPSGFCLSISALCVCCSRTLSYIPSAAPPPHIVHMRFWLLGQLAPRARSPHTLRSPTKTKLQFCFPTAAQPFKLRVDHTARPDCNSCILGSGSIPVVTLAGVTVADGRWLGWSP